MGIRIVTGPPFSGKTQKVAQARRPGDVVLDVTPIWRAFAKTAPDESRSEEDARVALAMMWRALEVAMEQGRDGFAIIAQRNIAKLRKWLDAAQQDRALLVSDTPWDELKERANERGPDCEVLLDKWDGYEDDADLAEMTDPWEDEMRSMVELETQYRAALDECGVRVGAELVQHRCLTDRAELRADMDDRTVMGVAVRYGDEARVYGFRERIARGALSLPTGPANLNRQHDRAFPLGLMEWIDDEDALRFKVSMTPGGVQDQALADVQHGLLRGASLEFVPQREKPVEMGDDPMVEVLEAKVLRLALVDDGAYPQSTVARAPMPQPKPEVDDEEKDRAEREGAPRLTLVDPDPVVVRPRRRSTVDRRILVAC